MADRGKDAVSDEGKASQEFAIPDGGLSTSMPDWLLQRPTWATADVATESATTEPFVAPNDDASHHPPVVRELPAPDTTPIQLADVLTVDDLPAWLRAVAERAERERVASEPAEIEPAQQSEPMAESTLAAAQRVVTPAVDVASRVPTHSSRSDMMLGGIMAAILLVVIFLILTMTNVI